MVSNQSTAKNPDVETIEKQLELFHLIFDNIYNGAMVTDANGIVTHLNKPYAQFLGLDAGDSIGKHCTDVVENTRMHIVARTGEPEINQTQTIRGQNIVVHRIPIKKGGKGHCRLRTGYVSGCGGSGQAGQETAPSRISGQTV
jgi:PAS domain S-box-containing protein